MPVAGPYALTSSAYAVIRRGAPAGFGVLRERTPDQTATAHFFNSNSATMVGDALIRHLESDPMDLLATARLFAMIHGAMTDSAIRVWGLKRDVGFWRPRQAVAGADTDGNYATASEAGWAPLVPNPNYSDYVSGHACLTGPAVEVIRRTLGEDTRSSSARSTPRRRGSTRTCPRSSTTPSTPASGRACTSAGPWSTATTSPTARPNG